MKIVKKIVLMVYFIEKQSIKECYPLKLIKLYKSHKQFIKTVLLFKHLQLEDLDKQKFNSMYKKEKE